MPPKKKLKVDEDKKENEKKTFRAQYLTVGLTYSRCPFTKEEVLKHLQSLSYRIGDYYIVQEEHTEPGKYPYHIHAWFQYDSKPNISSERYYDIPRKPEDYYTKDGVEKTTYHPNVGKKGKNWIWNYLKKFDKNQLTNIEDSFITKAIAGSLKEAVTQFQQQHPKDYAIHGKRIDENLRTLSMKDKVDHIYPFTGELPPAEWDHTSYTLFIQAPPDCGKTEWAKSYITHHLQMTYFRCTSVDFLKKYGG